MATWEVADTSPSTAQYYQMCVTTWNKVSNIDDAVQNQLSAATEKANALDALKATV